MLAKLIEQIFSFIFLYSAGYYNLSPFWSLAFVTSFFIINTILGINQDTKQNKTKEETHNTNHQKALFKNQNNEIPQRVEWLNQILKQFWFQIDEYAQNLVPKILEPIIQKYDTNFHFTVFKLGNKPLRIDGVRICDKVMDKGIIVMDLDISYSGDSCVAFQTTSIKCGGEVKDIQLNGPLRVVITLSANKFPLIESFQACFLKPPEINFDMTDSTYISRFPGIRSIIIKYAMNFIKSKYLYPNAFSINFTDGFNETEAVTFRNVIGILRVHMVEAKNLMDTGWFGKSDPYVTLEVGSSKVNTPYERNSLNPKWNFWNEFEIVISDPKLNIEVWDKNSVNKDECLGHASVDISEVKGKGLYDKDVATGTIFLQLTWLSLSTNYADLISTVETTALLNADLHNALLSIYLDSSLNLAFSNKIPPSAFVEVEVENEIKETKTVPRNSAPVWKTGFTFLIKDPRTATLRMTIKTDKNKNIGEVLFPIDNLKDEPELELVGHTFLCSKPYSETSICCTIKLQIMKNEHEEKVDNESAP